VLLERTSRTVSLTEAGSVLLTEGQAILAAVAAAERHTRRAATVDPHLVIVVKSGASDELLAKLLAAYAAEPDSIRVDVLLCESQQQQRLLREGQADLALLHRPYDSTVGFDSEDVYTEGQVAILPRAHPLAARPHVRMEEVATLTSLPMARWPSPSGGYPVGPGVEVHDQTQLLQHIALGRATVMLPESSRAHLREDLVAIPVLDAPLVTTVVAWPKDTRSRAIADLVRVALEVGHIRDAS
jgi:LysR family transcriptional regulator, benzoate and cis,cis-muconate-responsive activator of ben and cat genes